MYRRNATEHPPTATPPGYGGTLFSPAPTWPPPTPESAKRPHAHPFAPFAMPRPTEAPTERTAETPPSESEQAADAPSEENIPAKMPTEPPAAPKLPQNEETLLLAGILLLLLHGQTDTDLVSALAVLLLL